MASRTLTANGGDDRLVISTILTHLMVFHEAGIEFRTERKRRVEVVWWNPFTWGNGFEWRRSNAATQPTIQEFSFVQGADIVRDPVDFAVTRSTGTGRVKVSCVYFAVSWTSTSDPRQPPPPGLSDLGNDARSVNDVIVRFTYGGESRTLRHSDG